MEAQSPFTQEFINNCRKKQKEHPDFSEEDCITSAYASFTMKYGQEKSHIVMSILMRLAAPNIFSEEEVTA